MGQIQRAKGYKEYKGYQGLRGAAKSLRARHLLKGLWSSQELPIYLKTAPARCSGPSPVPSGRCSSSMRSSTGPLSTRSPTPPAVPRPSFTSVRLHLCRWRPSTATCRAAATPLGSGQRHNPFQPLRQDGGGARMRLKPPDRTLVPRCCLLRQLPTTFVGAFFQRGGVRGCEG